jgi:thiol peroxidase
MVSLVIRSLLALVLLGQASMSFALESADASRSPLLKVGASLPDAVLTGTSGQAIRLSGKKGRVKILSVVPQLNTPVCDEQTHHFSEQNGGLDRDIEIITLSTNSAEDQARFARKAKIGNITFLSDEPAHDFGKQTGLFLPAMGVLHRAVIVADTRNIVRYIEMVPMGQLPNFDAAYEAAQRILRSP